MDPELQRNVRFSEHDRPPNTPALLIEIPSNDIVNLALEAGIVITIRREEDGFHGPCIVHWDEYSDPWGSSGFMLFQHTHEGLEKVEGRHVPPSPSIIKLTERAGRFHQLLPGESFSLNIGNFQPFWDQFLPGERYELFWPGAEYVVWDWGSIHEHLDHEMGGDGHPRAIIPGGACCSFNVIEEEQVIWSAPGPDISSDRIPGTPALTLTLQFPSEHLSVHEDILVTIKITHDGIIGDDGKPILTGAKPVIFHNISTNVFQLDRRCHDYVPDKSNDESSEWEPDWHWDDYTPHVITEGPNYEVNVSQSERFVCLQVGESWSREVGLDATSFHPDTSVGDTYRYKCWGTTIDWWTWGDRKEHANTIVKFPPWGGDVIDPPDNEGKPKITLPPSNAVEFTIVE